MFAGQDTTSNLLTSLVYHLVCQPEIKEKLIAEMKEKLFEEGDEMTCDILNSLTLEKLNDMTYLQAFIKEALRHEATAGLANYETKKEIEICGVKIPKGFGIVANIASLGNSTESFESPREFIPERYIPGSKYSMTPTGGKRHPLSSIAFGIGPRSCVG